MRYNRPKIFKFRAASASFSMGGRWIGIPDNGHQFAGRIRGHQVISAWMNRKVAELNFATGAKKMILI